MDVTEFNVSLSVNKDSLSPKRNEGYYCQEMDINRALVTTALSVFADSGDSVFSPVKCVDVIGSTGIAGLLWKKHLGDKVEVFINDAHETSYEIILQNSKINNLDIKLYKKDPCVLLHEMPFSFVYLDCHTDAAFYLDSLMRNIAKRGLIAISTKDDGALYGRTPDIALRNYCGTITRTFYAKELAARLIIAGMVRSAAIHNKGLKVLCVLSVKSSITIILQILKGPAQANACLANIKPLIHCTMCEDRAFYPLSIYPIENPEDLLSCKCAANTPGKVIVNLGPIWSGQIFDTNFICQMIHHLNRFPWKNKLQETLETILTESRCTNIDEKSQIKSSSGNQDTQSLPQSHEEPPYKKKKKESTKGNSTEACFYFNLHKHCPKGPKMVKASNVVSSLQKAGFFASRTHFDSLSVRTTASLAELINVIAHTPR